MSWVVDVEDIPFSLNALRVMRRSERKRILLRMFT